MKVLHLIGGFYKNGAFKGANILHENLIECGIESEILNNDLANKNKNIKNIYFINNNFLKNIKYNFLKIIDKLFNSIFLPNPRSTFTSGLFGFDITKEKKYIEADIIHIHWLDQGFINIKSLSKIEKPIIWTMRDMWAFSGGAHYTIDFKNFEKSKLSNFLKKRKKKSYPKQMLFVSISNWLKSQAETSSVLSNFSIKRIYNNIDIDNFKNIPKERAMAYLKISTKKKILLYGAQDPQNNRKGWDIIIETLRNIDKSEYFLLLFGNFWSDDVLKKIGIEFKSLGFVNDRDYLNNIYCSSDIFLFPSKQEAFGKTWAEAMTCKIPVVCFDKSSASEFIDHKVDGFIVDKIDSFEFKKGIEWISSSYQKNNSNFSAFKKKLNNFDAKNIAKQYIQLYKELMTNKKKL